MDLVSEKLKFFGISKLHNFQEKVIESYLERKNTLVFVMTGGGKSLCYQLPAILDNKLVLVISPLKSLMKDQLDELEEKNIKGCIFSGDQSYEEKQKIMNNLSKGQLEYNIIYTNPESIHHNSNFLDSIVKINKKKQLGLIVFDEAHCLSLWGNDFRPSYLKMGILKEKIKNVPFMALTASATKKVETEIKKILKLGKDTVYIKESCRRNNLNIEISLKKGVDAYKDIEYRIKTLYQNQSGVIYCHSRKKCEKLYTYLLEKDIKTEFYHAGLEKNERSNIQDRWKSNQTHIVIATIAFGMGINKKDVRFVIHSNMPSSVENYYQEIGRGGRDGEKTDCILYYNYADKILQQKLISSNSDTKDKDYYIHQMNKLNDTLIYLENQTDCRHYLLTKYFGETDKFKCNDSCCTCKNNNDIEKIDITDICKKIFSIIVAKDVSRSKIKLVLKGKESSKKEFHLDKPISEDVLDKILIYLISHKYIKETITLTNNNLWYEKLHLYKRSQVVLENKKELHINIIKTNSIHSYFKKQSKLTKSDSNITKLNSNDIKEIDKTIYDLLASKRSEIAKDKQLPPYCILTNKVLESISISKPKTKYELLNIKGIGIDKADKYGSMILESVNSK
jgi:RecQ family ATP-dependent DNA helicase